MECFDLHILGCGSALPTTRHMATSQVINFRDKLYMIDCGEGTQVQMRKYRIKFGRLSHIFISHMHGDHCFGLPGLISTLGMLGRNGELVIHGPQELENYLRPMLALFCRDLPFQVRINAVNPHQSELIWEDRSLKVYSIPLKHRLPTTGFLFEEKEKELHLLADMAEFYQIPLKERQFIKKGEDYITPEGERIPNSRLTRPAEAARKYAYCSDTAYHEKIIPLVEGADVLYHEATFAESEAARASETYHSTARQAAIIARQAQVGKLIIGHYSARYEDNAFLKKEAQEIFQNTICAMEGMHIKL